MQISKQLKKGQNKKRHRQIWGTEDLISSTDDGDIIKGKILELENLIKKYYTQKSEAQKFAQEWNGRKKGKGQLDISLNLKKTQGQNKMWNRIKNTEGKYKYDIDSITVLIN
jgi:hypothetical protein